MTRALLQLVAVLVLTPAAAQAAESPKAIPSQNPQAALGKLLFFDRRLSSDKTVSCASCHSPKKGWADDRAVSTGVHGRAGRRNALSILNASSHRQFMWDGRAASLEQQVKLPLSDPNEMDMSSDEAAKTVAAIAGYAPYFTAAYGDSAVTFDRIAQAIASFERTIVSKDSPYDRHNAGDRNALSAEELRGMKLFSGKANCFLCHRLEALTNEDDFHNIGVGFDAQAKDKAKDFGLYEVTKQEGDKGSFRVASVRDLRYTAPYMHDGSMRTLEEVVDYYDKGGSDDPDLEYRIVPLHLSVAEKSDLVKFLGALSGDPVVMDPPAKFP